MPPNIPQSLQPKQQLPSQGLQKPPTVAEQKLIDKYGSLERANVIQQEQKIKNINNELKSFQSNLNYDNYEIEYNKLSSEAKSKVQSPSEFKKTEGYKQYQESKKSSKTQKAFEQIQRAAQGKRTMITRDIVDEYRRILKENPKLGRAVQRGTEARIVAGEYGFDEVGEFFNVSSMELKPQVNTGVMDQVKIQNSPEVYGSDFVGPLRPGETRSDKTTAELENSRQVYSRDFVGPLPEGAYYESQTSTTPNLQFQQVSEIGSISPAAKSKKTNEFQPPTIKQETQRYQDLGYTKSEATKIARESVKVGGMSFSPEINKRIINGETIKELQYLQRQYKNEQKHQTRNLDRRGSITGLGVSDNSISSGSGSSISLGLETGGRDNTIFGGFSRDVSTGQETEGQTLNGKSNVVFGGYSSNILGLETGDNSGSIITRFGNLFKERKEAREEQRKEFYDQPTISAFNQRKFSEGTKLSLFEATKRSGRALLNKDFSGVWKPFAQTGKLKADEKVYISEGQIISAERLSKFQKNQLEKTGIKIITREEAVDKILNKDKEYSDVKEILKDYQNPRSGFNKLSEDISKDLSSKYQKQIDSGKLSYDEASIQLENDFQKVYSEQSKKLEKGYKKYGDLYEYSGEAGKIGRFVTEGILISNPLTGSILGAGKVQEGSKEDIILLDKSGNLPLYPDTIASEKTKEGQFILSTGVLFPRVKIKNIEKSIVSDELKQLSEQPVKYGSVILKGTEKEGDIVFMKGTQNLGKLKTELDVVGKVVKEGEKVSVMPLGFAETRTTGELSYNLLGGVKPTKVIGVSSAQIGSKSYLVGQQGKLSAFISKEVTEPVGSMGAFTKGISKPKRDIKDISKQFTRTFRESQINPQPKIINIQPSIQAQVKEDLFFGVSSKGDKGFTKIIRASDDDSVKVIKGGTQRKTSFSSSFPEKKPLNSFEIQEKALQKQIPKEVNTPSVSRNTISKFVEKGTQKAFAPLVKQESQISARLISPVISRVGVRVVEQTKQIPSVNISQKPAQLLNQRKENVLDSRVESFIKTSPAQVQQPLQIQSPRVAQQEKQIQQQISQQSPTSFFFAGESISPRMQTPVKTSRVPLPEKGRDKVSKEQPYNVYVLRDSTDPKKRRYEQINQKPLTKESALSAGARETDESISARYKIEKVQDIVQKVKDFAGRVVSEKKIKPKAIDTGDNYFQVNKNKFRPYRVQKGKKIATPGVYIEKASARLDSPREIRRVQMEKQTAQVAGMFGLRR